MRVVVRRLCLSSLFLRKMDQDVESLKRVTRGLRTLFLNWNEALLCRSLSKRQELSSLLHPGTQWSPEVFLKMKIYLPFWSERFQRESTSLTGAVMLDVLFGDSVPPGRDHQGSSPLIEGSRLDLIGNGGNKRKEMLVLVTQRIIKPVSS
jgi:hypothetical protein